MGSLVAPVVEGRLEPDERLDETGNVPADALYAGFYMQAPTKELALYATLLENLWNDEFVDGYQAMAQWSRDHVPFPGAAARQIVDELVRKNVLMTGRCDLGGASSTSPSSTVTSSTRSPRRTTSSRRRPPSRRARSSGKAERRRASCGSAAATSPSPPGSRAFKRTLPAIMAWLAEHSDELDPPQER